MVNEESTFLKGNIAVQNLNVTIRNEVILKNINIVFPENKITAIMGPSGCGKTTLLKCFNRLNDSVEHISIKGRVLVDNEDIYQPEADLLRIRKKMGLLSQRPFPLPISIYNNIAYGPRLHGARDKKKLDEIVEYYLRAANIWEEVKDRLNSPATELSLGQQQRLCLARGLAVEPKIILCDEPTSALDPRSSQRIEELFIQLKKDYTIIIVTHILRQARRVADYIVYMYMGEVIEHGPAAQILENPKEKLTIEYIKGTIN
jgi:phosphate transport system ATP-binding protein